MGTNKWGYGESAAASTSDAEASMQELADAMMLMRVEEEIAAAEKYEMVVNVRPRILRMFERHAAKLAEIEWLAAVPGRRVERDICSDDGAEIVSLYEPDDPFPVGTGLDFSDALEDAYAFEIMNMETELE